TALCRGPAFQQRQRVRRTFYPAGLELFGERNLFRRKILVTLYSRPRSRGMTAVQKLFVNGFVACAAVRRGGPGINDKTNVVRARLTRCNLMAIETGDTFFSVLAHFVLMNDGILKVPVALGALATRTNESLGWLLDLNPGAARIQKKRRQNQRRRDSDGYKN